MIKSPATKSSWGFFMSHAVKKDLPLLDKYFVLTLKIKIMSKSLDTKKAGKKEPLKTAKEKKEEKREKKNNPKRD